MHRVRAHTAAGAFATLIVMIPWKLLETSGFTEDRAAATAFAFLALAAAIALPLSKTQLAQRRFDLPAFRDTFELPAFLRAFAAYSLGLIALLGSFWLLR